MSSPGNFWTEKILPHVPRIIQHNFWRLLFSFIFAFLLFNFVHKTVQEETDYHIITINDVEIRVVPDAEGAKTEAIRLVPQKGTPTVSVTLSVPVYEKSVSSRDLYLECPVTKKQIDENVPVSFKVENLKLRRGIYFKDPRIHPSALSLDLDYYVEKNVPVKPYFDSNEIVDGYQLETEPKPDVMSVKVSGPKKVLAGITQLKTEKIPLANKTQGFTCTVDLVLPFEARNNDVKIFSDAVQVSVKIKKNGLRTFERIPVRVLEGKGGANELVIAEIYPETVFVTVEEAPGDDFLDRRKIEDLSPDHIHAVLDLSGVKDAGQYHDRIRFWSDDDQFRVIKVEPRNASVKLVSPSASK